jgi:hypothetical protein
VISWTTAFLDFPTETFDAGVAFWSAVTGCTLSTSRGDGGEFATLLPPDGDAFLRVQRLGEGPERVHLDLHTPEATRLTLHESPGGLPWCGVPVREQVRPAPADWGTHVSLVDQVCLDIPAGLFEAEVAWWQELTGWELAQSALRREYWALQRPPGNPLRFLLQRLDSGRGTVGAHLDIATSHVALEVARHRELGAEVLAEMPWWTTMQSPTGTAYSITSRNQATGVL